MLEGRRSTDRKIVSFGKIGFWDRAFELGPYGMGQIDRLYTSCIDHAVRADVVWGGTVYAQSDRFCVHSTRQHVGF